MKRFYKVVSIESEEGAFTVKLDGRSVRSPAKRPLLIPSRPAAEAVAEEWRDQREEIDPSSMPMLRLVNTAVDIVAQNRNEIVRNLSGYGDTDLLYYLADTPADLRAAQTTAWRPVLDWAEGHMGVRFQLGEGINYIGQDAETIRVLRDSVAAHDDMELAALNDLVSISGSLLLALAHSQGTLSVERFWHAAQVDEAHQAQRWGWDAEAAQVAERRRNDVEQAPRFLALHRQGLN